MVKDPKVEPLGLANGKRPFKEDLLITGMRACYRSLVAQVKMGVFAMFSMCLMCIESSHLLRRATMSKDEQLLEKESIHNHWDIF
jgi:hypothetical protein